MKPAPPLKTQAWGDSQPQTKGQKAQGPTSTRHWSQFPSRGAARPSQMRSGTCVVASGLDSPASGGAPAAAAPAGESAGGPPQGSSAAAAAAAAGLVRPSPPCSEACVVAIGLESLALGVRLAAMWQARDAASLLLGVAQLGPIRQMGPIGAGEACHRGARGA